ncbi:unnamed protein product [Paramecium sonneborni]|uniref:Uncharacterized protein n=1 Tax=Paramecium sonneborni TaxID=65129 RepID=A0A8S1QC23_9CILI|nr:unnamed protein product [Paramecium sonneborni]
MRTYLIYKLQKMKYMMTVILYQIINALIADFNAQQIVKLVIYIQQFVEMKSDWFRKM